LELRTLQEICAFGKVQSCWRASRDKISLEELPDGRVRMRYIGAALPEGQPSHLIIGSANVAYTFPA